MNTSMETWILPLHLPSSPHGSDASHSKSVTGDLSLCSFHACGLMLRSAEPSPLQLATVIRISKMLYKMQSFWKIAGLNHLPIAAQKLCTFVRLVELLLDCKNNEQY